MNYSYQGRHSRSQLVAMAARMNTTAIEFDAQPWFADSGANNHITSAWDNLTL